MFHGYKLGQQITDDNDDLHRGQRSTEVKYGVQYRPTWLPHLVRCTVIQAKDDDDDDDEGHPQVR